jgi:hypothetical protein
VDLAVALALAMGMAALALPRAARALDNARGRHAAGYLAAELSRARQLAVVTRRTTGIVFEQIGGDWTYRLCRDGNGNGLRRSEVSTGIDGCDTPPTRISERVSATVIEIGPGIPGPDADPPAPDPVRFGATDIASCSASGGCSPGTVFVRSASGDQFAARLGGITGRVRVLRFEVGTGQWVTE